MPKSKHRRKKGHGKAIKHPGRSKPLAEYIAELEERAMRFREMAMQAQTLLPDERSRMMADISFSMRALGLEEAALLARRVTAL